MDLIAKIKVFFLESSLTQSYFAKYFSVDNPCSAKPCRNNATCFNLSTSLLTQNDRSYGCRCAIGFTGSQCEISTFYTTSHF